MLSQLLIAGHVQQLLGDDLKTEIQARFPLEQFALALRHYAADMTAGKVLLDGEKGASPENAAAIPIFRRKLDM